MDNNNKGPGFFGWFMILRMIRWKYTSCQYCNNPNWRYGNRLFKDGKRICDRCEMNSNFYQRIG